MASYLLISKSMSSLEGFNFILWRDEAIYNNNNNNIIIKKEREFSSITFYFIRQFDNKNY